MSAEKDDTWERFLRESEAGVADAPKEPSARAREVTRRLRENPGPPPGWRTHEPAGSRRGRGGRRRGGWYVVGFALSIALLIVALAPGKVVDLFADATGGTSAAGPTGTPRPGSDPDATRPTRQDPFAGSPAAAWEDGAAGIVVPPARATGWMDAEQVAHALDVSREFTADTGLDPGALRGERPAEALARIDPRQGDLRATLSEALRAPTERNDPLTLFSRFDPARVSLVGSVVKTRGELTFREGQGGGVEVTADVTFVYPVAPADAGARSGGSGDGPVERTIVRRELVMLWENPETASAAPDTFALTSRSVHISNGGCGDGPVGWLNPRFGPADPGSGPTGRGPAIDPYDRRTAIPETGGDTEGCGTVTRT
ncbi:hypothetical protein ACN20G_31840 (plasmid) [Streptomyces sp. BI20]|uniref:hypothetical protein n=1 Tax=Streptomyces sp. BI20 TaxID=3403460 RepID=UPI003C7577D4